MPSKPQTSKEYFTLLAILHGTLLVAQVVFGAVAYYLVSTGQFPSTQDLTGILKIVAVVALSAGLIASSLVSKAQLKSIRQKSALRDKLKDYQKVLLIKWALLETPSLFCFVCFLMTGSYFILGLAAPAILLFITYRPTPANAILDLELSPSEKKLIEDPNSIVTEVGQGE